MEKDHRRRVKCANCGMIYDIAVSNWLGDPLDLTGIGVCPKCGSNASDDLTLPNITQYT